MRGSFCGYQYGTEDNSFDPDQKQTAPYAMIPVEGQKVSVWYLADCIMAMQNPVELVFTEGDRNACLLLPVYVVPVSIVVGMILCGLTSLRKDSWLPQVAFLLMVVAQLLTVVVKPELKRCGYWWIPVAVVSSFTLTGTWCQRCLGCWLACCCCCLVSHVPPPPAPPPPIAPLSRESTFQNSFLESGLDSEVPSPRTPRTPREDQDLLYSARRLEALAS